MSEKNLYTKLYKSVEEVLDKANSANGHRFDEYNVNHRSLKKKAKGSLGQIVEEGLFGYPVNSDAEADFANLGLELKVTGLKRLKNGQLHAKERLVLNIINYDEEVNKGFYQSSFWHKSQHLLIMFYLYDYNREDANYQILKSFLHDFSDKDLEIIKNDWKIIHDKIVSGRAEDISEGDTMYLAACTKGADGNSYRIQPNSDVPAPQRAYCLKPSYMNSFVERVFEDKTYEQIVGFSDLKGRTFEGIIRSKLSRFFGRTESDLLDEFGIDSSNKAKFSLLCSRMLGIKGNINDTEEFRKANIQLKTIRVEEDGNIRENMSFPHFTFKEIIQQEWEDSGIFNLLYSTKFLFVVFKKVNGEYRLKGVKLWNMPYPDIEKYVKPVFEEAQRVVREGHIVKAVQNGKYMTNFPGVRYNHVCHIRPHDAAGIDRTGKGYELPVPDVLTGKTRFTKQCFWLDRNYIKKVIKDLIS